LLCTLEKKQMFSMIIYTDFDLLYYSYVCKQKNKKKPLRWFFFFFYKKTLVYIIINLVEFVKIHQRRPLLIWEYVNINCKCFHDSAR